MGSSNQPTQILSQTPGIRLATADVTPPASVYITQDDVLFIQVQSVFAGAVINIRVRVLLPDGTVSFNAFDVITSGNRAQDRFTFPLPEGFILTAQVQCQLLTPVRGQIFATLQVNRGVNFPFQIGQVLCQGYLTAQTNPYFPGGQTGYSVEGTGWSHAITGSTPAAAAEISEVVPFNAMWAIRTVRFTLTTSAVVANRVVTLTLDDFVLPFGQVTAPNVQAASLTWTYCFSQCAFGLNFFANSFQQCVLPLDLLIRTGGHFKTATTALQAGDQFSAPQYYVEEWISN